MSEVNDDSPGTELPGLLGRTLSAVVFVHDYLQLQFDGAVMTFLTWPLLATPEVTTCFGSDGYRDGLCGRIGTTVTDIRIAPDRQIVLRFSDGSQLTISLAPDSHPGPETVIYTSDDERTWVW